MVLHVVVVDDKGSVTGVQGSILERSSPVTLKAYDAFADGDSPTRIYYKDYIQYNSEYVFLVRTHLEAWILITVQNH